jgi:uncharacterized protein (DUF2147 family)
MLITSPYEAQEDDEINLVENQFIYDVEQLDDGRWRGTTEDKKRGLFPVGFVSKITAPDKAESITAFTSVSNQVTPGMRRSQRGRKKGSGKEVNPSPPSPRPIPQRVPAMFIISPYETQEDNEINLVEDQFIYDPEQLDDGRWRGTTEDGKRGLFPVGCVSEFTAPSEAESITAFTSVPNQVTSGMQRPQRGRSEKEVNSSPPSPRPIPQRVPAMLITSPYEAQEDDEINLVEDQFIYDAEQLDDGRWRGTTEDKKSGFFPVGCVSKITAPGEAESTTVFTSVSNQVTPGMRRSQRGKKKGKRTGGR